MLGFLYCHMRICILTYVEKILLRLLATYRILNMPDANFFPIRLALNSDDIDLPVNPANIMRRQVNLRGGDEMPLLGFGNGFFRCSKAAVFSGFYFHKNKSVPFPTNKIDFAIPRIKIFLNNRTPLLRVRPAQEPRRHT